MQSPSYIGLPSDEELLANPSVSYWLKDAMRAAAKRDVCDAYHDATLLTAILLRRVDTALGNLGCAKKMEVSQ